MPWEETPWQHKVSPDGDRSSLKGLMNSRARRGLGGCRERKKSLCPGRSGGRRCLIRHMIHEGLCWLCSSDFSCLQLQRHSPDSPSWKKLFKDLKMMFGQGCFPAKSSLHPMPLLRLTEGHHFWGHCAIFPNKAGVVPRHSEEAGIPHSPMTTGGQVRLMWQLSKRRCLVRCLKREVCSGSGQLGDDCFLFRKLWVLACAHIKTHYQTNQRWKYMESCHSKPFSKTICLSWYNKWGSK